MKKFKFTIRGNEYEVEMHSLEDGIAKLEVNGTRYKVELHKESRPSKTPVLVRSPLAKEKDAHLIKKSSEDTFKIKAPLPGNILNVFVKAGDTVVKGDKLLVYEAMKMENILLSEKTGSIKEVKIKQGDAVLQEDVLFELIVN
jgi:glutaconyl-CoA/methylmalonyl-CoA decarboxylase subunit gamma